MSDNEKFYFKEDAQKRAEELTQKAREALIESHPLENKVSCFFEHKLGSDEVLEEWYESPQYNVDEATSKDETDRFLKYDLDYTLISTKEKYDRYKAEKNGTETVYTTGYSGTVSSDGHVSLSPNTESGEIPVYEVFFTNTPGTELFSGYYKVLKKKDVGTVREAEKKIWKNRREYQDVAYADNEVSTWKKASKLAFFIKYGLFPLIPLILMTFAAFLFPKLVFSLPWATAGVPFLLIWIRDLCLLYISSDIIVRFEALSPYIAIAAWGVALLLVILLSIIKGKIAYRFMYDRQMECYDAFFGSMFIAGGCILLSFLLSMVPAEVPDAGFILSVLLWLSRLLSNLLWVAVFVFLFLALGTIFLNGFGVGLAHKINKRIWELKDYVASGQYEKDKEIVNKIKSCTVKTTAQNFNMPMEIDLNNITTVADPEAPANTEIHI